MKPLHERYKDEKPAGVYSMGYCGYLFFEPIEDDKYSCDFVVCREYPNSADPKGYTRAEYRRHNVKYTLKCRPYINRDGSKLYLDDVLRADYWRYF